MEKTKWLALFACCLAVVLTSSAGTTKFEGVTVDYGSASTNWVGGDLVLTYKSSSSLTVAGDVHAHVLAVGGGGGGGSGYSSSGSNSYGNGGNGGAVQEQLNQVLSAGTYTISVGAGGGGSNSTSAGGNGSSSYIQAAGSDSLVTAAGGAGGASRKSASQKAAGTGASGSGTAGVTSVLTRQTYGQGGVAGTSSSAQDADNFTGNGGDGGRNNSNSTARKGGRGGSGIVIVRLTEEGKSLHVLRDVRVGPDEMVSEFREGDETRSFDFSTVTFKSSVDVVAEVTRTSDGKVGVVGRLPGQSRITIVDGGATYLMTVTVGSLISGSIRVGAYEVDVRNASRTNWVDGELVITYLNANAAIDKSFTLPRPTTGRILVVGGGGAGGQEQTRDDECGLPGGGGAGGFVTNDCQAFSAAQYTVTVGAGGATPATLKKQIGENGGESLIEQSSTVIVTAQGGGGGGVQSLGKDGGCGGGGSASSASSSGKKLGGSGKQSSTGAGVGFNGGAGNHVNCGAGGGGAGGEGSPTGSTSSGDGGPGAYSMITGENIVYARGGPGGATRVMPYFYIDENGVRHPVSKMSNVPQEYKGYLFDAKDGRPGMNGRGDGGGGSGYYSTSEDPTRAGSGGSGVVIVRIPPYSIYPEDAIRRAFPAESINLVQVGEKWVATLLKNVEGPVSLPDNIGKVEVALDGHAILGASGANGNDITPGGTAPRPWRSFRLFTLARPDRLFFP